MKYDEIIIKTNTAGSEFLAGELIVNGITSFSVDDPKDFLDIIKEKSVPFDYYDSNLVPKDTETVTVTVYLTRNEQGEDRKAFVLASAAKMQKEPSFGNVSVSYSESDDKDWENNWKEYFHPLEIGKKLIIKPSWETCEPRGRIMLEIDPESSFGSGRHETTKLCLELMENHNLKGSRMLDMGCGSGILGIAGCLMGAAKCVCVDIEQNAIEITKKNSAVNHITAGTLEAYVGNVLEDEKLVGIVGGYSYDIIVSNIVADVLADMLPLFRKILKNGGYIILSGIIAPRRERILTALSENGFDVKEIRQENDWIGIEARKV